MTRKPTMKPTTTSEKPTTEKNTSVSPGATASPWLTKQQAADYLGKSISWISHAVATGLIQCYRPGKSVYFNVRELDEFILSARQTVKPLKTVEVETPPPVPVKAKPVDQELPPIFPNLDSENTIEVRINGEWWKARILPLNSKE